MAIRPIKVVVVDDSEFVLEITKHELEAQGLEVFTVNSPIGFSQLLRDRKPDIALVDVSMPALQGPSSFRSRIVTAPRTSVRWCCFPTAAEANSNSLPACGAAEPFASPTTGKALRWKFAAFWADTTAQATDPVWLVSSVFVRFRRKGCYKSFSSISWQLHRHILPHPQSARRWLVFIAVAPSTRTADRGSLPVPSRAEPRTGWRFIGASRCNCRRQKPVLLVPGWQAP